MTNTVHTGDRGKKKCRESNERNLAGPSLFDKRLNCMRNIRNANIKYIIYRTQYNGGGGVSEEATGAFTIKLDK